MPEELDKKNDAAQACELVLLILAFHFLSMTLRRQACSVEIKQSIQ
jgi:hypothetical protein